MAAVLASAQLGDVKTLTPTIPGDLLQSTTLNLSAPLGTLAYLTEVPIHDRPKRDPFQLVIQPINSAADGPLARNAYTISPPLSPGIFDPQFSPDGRYVLLKAGESGDRMGTYRFYFWDCRLHSLKNGPIDELRYRQLYWSPDSRFVAYFQGGDQNGSNWNYTLPLKLFIYDTEKGKSHFVADSSGNEQVAWTQKHTLLFEAPPSKRRNRVGTAVQPGENSPPPASSSENVTVDDITRPCIYEAPAEGGKPKLVLPYAYDSDVPSTLPSGMPLPSPDGKWIGFYGWLNHNSLPGGSPRVGAAVGQLPETGALSDIPALCLFNRLTKERSLVEPGKTAEERFWLWTPDSQQLISAELNYTTEANGKTLGHVHIRTFDVQARQTREVGVLELENAESGEGPIGRPNFQPLHVTRDGKFLLVESAQYMDVQRLSNGSESSTVLATVQAVSLKDGRATTLFTLKNPDGMDWLDQSGTVNPVVTRTEK